MSESYRKDCAHRDISVIVLQDKGKAGRSPAPNYGLEYSTRLHLAKKVALTKEGKSHSYGCFLCVCAKYIACERMMINNVTLPWGFCAYIVLFKIGSNNYDKER